MRAALLSIGVLLAGTAGASACPDWKQSGQKFSLTGQELYSEQSFPIQAGGNTNIANCKTVSPETESGDGFVMARPDFTFDLTGLSGYKLVLSTRSQCDSVLLVNTSTARWFYNDDGAGNLDARIEFGNPEDGLVDVWVGTHDGELCEAVLALETFQR